MWRSLVREDEFFCVVVRDKFPRVAGFLCAFQRIDLAGRLTNFAGRASEFSGGKGVMGTDWQTIHHPKEQGVCNDDGKPCVLELFYYHYYRSLHYNDVVAHRRGPPNGLLLLLLPPKGVFW